MSVLPPRIGDLDVLSVDVQSRRRGQALCRCLRGHEQWRPLATLMAAVHRNQHVMCRTCGPMPTDLQLNVLAAVATFGELRGCGPTTREMGGLLGSKVINTLRRARDRGLIWFDTEHAEWHLTEAGWFEVDWTVPDAGEVAAE